MVPPSGTHGTEECVLYPRRGYLIVTPDGRGLCSDQNHNRSRCPPGAEGQRQLELTAIHAKRSGPKTRMASGFGVFMFHSA